MGVFGAYIQDHTYIEHSTKVWHSNLPIRYEFWQCLDEGQLVVDVWEFLVRICHRERMTLVTTAWRDWLFRAEEYQNISQTKKCGLSALRNATSGSHGLRTTKAQLWMMLCGPLCPPIHAPQCATALTSLWCAAQSPPPPITASNGLPQNS
jgi:hypothetical protein